MLLFFSVVINSAFDAPPDGDVTPAEMVHVEKIGWFSFRTAFLRDCSTAVIDFSELPVAGGTHKGVPLPKHGTRDFYVKAYARRKITPHTRPPGAGNRRLSQPSASVFAVASER